MSMTGRYVRLPEGDLESLVAAPKKLMDYVLSEGLESSGRQLDIDKTWHLIHFLLNGDPMGGEGPLGTVVLGGFEVEGEDTGYGPPRYMWPDDVRQLAGALAPVSSADLWARFDAAAVAKAEIYPGAWTGGDEDREYVTENFDSLKAFFADAARDKQAVILFLA